MNALGLVLLNKKIFENCILKTKFLTKSDLKNTKTMYMFVMGGISHFKKPVKPVNTYLTY